MASMPQEPKAGVSGWVSETTKPRWFILDTKRGLSSDQTFMPEAEGGEARFGVSGKSTEEKSVNICESMLKF